MSEMINPTKSQKLDAFNAVCPDGLCCDTAREVGCLHSGFHASDTGGCDGCSQCPGGGCVKASEYTNPDEIAAFESLVEAYLVPDVELSQSGKTLRDEIINSIENMSSKMKNYEWEKYNKIGGWARG